MNQRRDPLTYKDRVVLMREWRQTLPREQLIELAQELTAGIRVPEVLGGMDW